MTPPEGVRIGVFVCHCGSNIAGVVDCGAVTRYAAGLPGVVFAAENLYTCSEAGLAEIQNAIRDHGLNRVIVASCSPRTHQPLFQSACAAAGLNPYLFEMVNIRDQCSWVHREEKERATEKACDLVRMGAAKSGLLGPQADIEAPLTPRALVIGGGVAGLSAAGALADLGLGVVLVEKGPALGGLLTALHRLGPGGDDPRELADRLIEAVKARPEVTVYTSSRVASVEGYIGNFEVAVRQDDGHTVRERVGCLVVATGAVPFEPDGLFGHDGRRVITQMELERRLREETLP
ncbi:MAG: FAD-dependent oxidoreductase, partial [Thermodesulfobacteriota bacterium]